MINKFLKINGTFLLGWITLLSIILVFQILVPRNNEINIVTSHNVVTVQKKEFNEEVKPHFFPLMFFYSK